MLAVVGGCVGGIGEYTNGGLYPDDVVSVYVEMFDSSSLRRQHEVVLTDAICKRIESETPYKIVSDRNRADTVLSGSLSAVGSGVLATDRKKKQDVEEQRKQTLNRKRFMDSGLWFYQQGFYEKAVNEFKKALECSPRYARAHQSLGDAYFRMGMIDKAKTAYMAARKQDPDNINILENLGVIYANQGGYKKDVW